MTVISSAASMSSRTPEGSYSRLSAAPPTAISNLAPMRRRYRVAATGRDETVRRRESDGLTGSARPSRGS